MGLEYLNKPCMGTQKTQFQSSKHMQFYRCRHFYNPKYIDPVFGCSLKIKRQGYCCLDVENCLQFSSSFKSSKQLPATKSFN